MKTINLINAIIGCGLLAVFVIGLAHSISTGFAGFWGGLPFWVIVMSVLALVGYNFWEDTIGRR